MISKVIVLKNIIPTLRWLTSILFFYLTIEKALFLYNNGLDPYKQLIRSFQLPTWIAYYGVVAGALELTTAIALWVKKMFSPAVILMGSLVCIGVGLSAWSIMYKIQSECGCGLFGDDEYFILAQKLIILIVLILLYRGRETLFQEQGG